MALATLDEIKQLIDPEDTQQMVNLKFASFGTHPDHQQVSLDEIYRYLSSMRLSWLLQSKAMVLNESRTMF